MPRFICCVLLSFATLLVADEKSEKSKKLLNGIQGKWKFVEVVREGVKLDPKEFQNATTEVTGNILTTTDPDQKHPSVMELIALDGDQSPSHVQLRPKGLPREESAAILEIDGDTLKICGTMEDAKVRPTKFEGGKDVLFLVMKRVK